MSAMENDQPPNKTGAGASRPSSSNSMFSAAPTRVLADIEKPETEQLNLRIGAELYRQLERATVVLGARRGVPTNRVTVVEEALSAFFEQNKLS
jgi:hypothetical protein